MNKKVVIGIIVLALALLLSSCSRRQYIPIVTVKTDSVNIYKHLRDSIYIYDSVYVKEKGDTVYVDRYKYRYIDKVRIDTMYVIQCDSIRIPYPVERRLGKWEQLKMDAGGIALGLVIITFSLIIIRYILRRYGRR